MSNTLIDKLNLSLSHGFEMLEGHYGNKPLAQTVYDLCIGTVVAGMEDTKENRRALFVDFVASQRDLSGDSREHMKRVKNSLHFAKKCFSSSPHGNLCGHEANEIIFRSALELQKTVRDTPSPASAVAAAIGGDRGSCLSRRDAPLLAAGLA